jgi:hypothetical protein
MKDGVRNRKKGHRDCGPVLKDFNETIVENFRPFFQGVLIVYIFKCFRGFFFCYLLTLLYCMYYHDLMKESYFIEVLFVSEIILIKNKLFINAYDSFIINNNIYFYGYYILHLHFKK